MFGTASAEECSFNLRASFILALQNKFLHLFSTMQWAFKRGNSSCPAQSLYAFHCTARTTLHLAWQVFHLSLHGKGTLAKAVLRHFATG